MTTRDISEQVKELYGVDVSLTYGQLLSSYLEVSILTSV